MIKWDKARVGYYVGIDIAEGSVSSSLMLADDIMILAWKII